MSASVLKMSTNLLVALFLLSSIIVLVSSQSTGRGGGKCFENNSTVYDCPTYNYTRYPGDYELRTYDLDTWAIETNLANASVIPHDTPQPIEGLISCYGALNDYFAGANAAKLMISRLVAPVAVATVPVQAGVFAYAGIFFLPPLSSYPPPAPTNSSVTVIGGPAAGHLQAYVRQYSLEKVPSDDEINDVARRFNAQLTNDGRKFQNLTIAGFYNIITATGNWTKEIWYLATGDESLQSNWATSLTAGDIKTESRKPIHKRRGGA